MIDKLSHVDFSKINFPQIIDTMKYIKGVTKYTIIYKNLCTRIFKPRFKI